MKERSVADAGHAIAPAGTDEVGRARVTRTPIDEGQLWTLPHADEPVADRLLSLGIAGVTGFVDGGKDGAGAWLFRKLAATSLADRMRDRRGPWPSGDALAAALSIARALAACERLSLFPGPIAPEEIACSGTVCALRAEALVRSLVGARESGALALASSVSPRWTPPEQASGEVWDGAANRYVLGLILYRLLGGEHPFAGAGLRHALEEAAHREPPPFVESVARELPSGLQSFALRLLSPDAGERPKSAQAIAETLAAFLRGDAPAAAEKPRRATPAPSAAAPSAPEPREGRERASGGPSIARIGEGASPAARSGRAAAVLRFWPLAAGVVIAAAAFSLLAPPKDRPRAATVPATQEPLRANETASKDCADCHSRQTTEWRRSVMAHALKSPLFNALEMIIEEQVGRDFDCANGAGVLRRADDRTACKDPRTGLTITGTGGEHWCISCHSPSENLESAMPAWDGRATGDAATRRPPRDLLGKRAVEGISCGFCHQVHGPVGPRGSRGYEGNPTWRSPVTGATFAARPEDDRGLFGIGNSGYDLRPEELILGVRGAAGANAGSEGRPDPIVHARASRTASAYLATSEFCGSCHDVRLFGTDTLGAAKGEHFKRLRNAYTEWADWAKRERRADRVAPTCQDCHMSRFPGTCAPVGEYPATTVGNPYWWDGICPPWTRFTPRAPGSYAKALAADNSPEAGRAVTHYFSGVDVPLALEYPEQLVDETSIDLNGVPMSVKKRRDMLLRVTFRMTLEQPRRVGGTLEIPLVVENVGAGHKVPAGFSQEREIWVNLTVRDASGSVVYQSGNVTRADQDLGDKRIVRVNVSDAITDGKGRPLGVFGADVQDGADVPLWDPPPITGATRFRGRGLVNFQNGFLRCVRCIGEIAADGRCLPASGQNGTRAARFDDGDYDIDTGECRSNLSGSNALFETYLPVGSLDATRGVFRGPDAIIDTRSLLPSVPVTYTYVLPAGGRRGPFDIEARLLFRAFPPYLVRAFIDYENEQARKGKRPNGPLVTDEMLKRLEIVQVARATAGVE